MEIGLRPYRLEDAPQLLDAARESADALQPWMPWCHPGFSLGDSRTWAERQIEMFPAGEEFEFVIEDRDGRFLGGCGLNHLDHYNRRANLGYWVRSSATRQGVATRAVTLLVDWAFRNTPLTRLEIVIAQGNVASLGVAKKAGAAHEGTLRNRIVLHGTAHDAELFAFVR